MSKTYPVNTPDELWRLLDALTPKHHNLNDAVLDAIAARVLDLQDQLHEELDEEQLDEIEAQLIHGLPDGGDDDGEVDE